MDYLMTLAADPAVWAALGALIAMEVVLGIDNLIFISILTNKLPEHQRSRGRKIGIGLALILRLALLGTVAIIVQLTAPIFSVFGKAFSWRDLILIAGGMFLLWKATTEIREKVQPHTTDGVLDTKTTAVGMTDHIPVMVIAVVFAVLVMLLAADPLALFIEKNPTIVMLALGFLLMIGGTLIGEGFGAHVPKGYIYAAMAFSAAIEGLNMLSRRASRKKGG